MYKTSLMVLALFLGEEVAAIRMVPDDDSHVQFRPYTTGRTPWYKSPPKEPKIEFKHDYFVPNFGVDQDVVTTQQHIAGQEQRLGIKYDSATFKKAPGPKDIRRPNFGDAERDIMITHKNMANAETSTGHQFHASFKPAPVGYAQDYFVPNFGKDRDVEATLSHAKGQEQRLGHQWVALKPKAKPHPVDYAVPNFGQDHDIKVSLHNQHNAEMTLGQAVTLQNAADIHLESDPICDSSGCNQYKHKKKDPGYDKDYPVVDLGVDRDIVGSHEDLAVAEGIVHHKLIMGTDESKAKWKNPAKKTDYDYSPKLDKDMHDAATNLDLVEGKLGHKYEPWK